MSPKSLSGLPSRAVLLTVVQGPDRGAGDAYAGVGIGLMTQHGYSKEVIIESFPGKLLDYILRADNQDKVALLQHQISRGH